PRGRGSSRPSLAQALAGRGSQGFGEDVGPDGAAHTGAPGEAGKGGAGGGGGPRRGPAGGGSPAGPSDHGAEQSQAGQAGVCRYYAERQGTPRGAALCAPGHTRSAGLNAVALAGTEVAS